IVTGNAAGSNGSNGKLTQNNPLTNTTTGNQGSDGNGGEDSGSSTKSGQQQQHQVGSMSSTLAAGGNGIPYPTAPSIPSAPGSNNTTSTMQKNILMIGLPIVAVVLIVIVVVPVMYIQQQQRRKNGNAVGWFTRGNRSRKDSIVTMIDLESNHSFASGGKVGGSGVDDEQVCEEWVEILKAMELSERQDSDSSPPPLSVFDGDLSMPVLEHHHHHHSEIIIPPSLSNVSYRHQDHSTTIDITSLRPSAANSTLEYDNYVFSNSNNQIIVPTPIHDHEETISSTPIQPSNEFNRNDENIEIPPPESILEFLKSLAESTAALQPSPSSSSPSIPLRHSSSSTFNNVMPPTPSLSPSRIKPLAPLLIRSRNPPKKIRSRSSKEHLDILKRVYKTNEEEGGEMDFNTGSAYMVGEVASVAGVGSSSAVVAGEVGGLGRRKYQSHVPWRPSPLRKSVVVRERDGGNGKDAVLRESVGSEASVSGSDGSGSDVGSFYSDDTLC
ncbi:hypothetical protein HDU76_005280, partial [Blyttiomyces sp. JEL0837]